MYNIEYAQMELFNTNLNSDSSFKNRFKLLIYIYYMYIKKKWVPKVNLDSWWHFKSEVFYAL